MKAPSIINDLVKRFERNYDAYHDETYKETELCREFLDPFFKALGWDVDNSQGYAEAYKDVVHEESLKVRGSTLAPDYSFRIGGVRKFFLEAKKPSISVKDSAEPAYQLRRYAWSASLHLSIVSNFEEFAVYDSQIRPSPSDKPAKARILYMGFREYVERWAEIAERFSKEAILRGSFDKYASEGPKRKGSSRFDSAFLEEIEGWRELLARNIALRNPGIDQYELNFSVQQTLDRIIFLRICEDRGIEPQGRLLALANGGGIYERMRRYFRSADERYNSGLFHFRKEPDRPGTHDRLTLSLEIDDKVLREILQNLYPPHSPYEFSVVPADILGQVYERFLGRTIRLTAGGRASIEEKPEVRRAGGVFYTPTFVVKHIVERTVGPLLEGKEPRQVAKLRILDPACGSGSFLIEAYQYLLDWHLVWYTHHRPEAHSKGRSPSVYHSERGWRLTTAERKRILLNSIYGVDIDPQAVEVTKLSLLLKVLEGESDETLNSQLRLFQDRALPDLDMNIRCGNSLVDPELFSGQLDIMRDEAELRRINAFDWEAEFSHVMRAGGFDAVIGNPPYIRIQTLQEWQPEAVNQYLKSYQSARTGNYDIYIIFIEKGLSLLNEKGRLGFIVPQKLYHVQYGEALRTILSREGHVKELLSFGYNQVFADAFINTCILILTKSRTHTFSYTEVSNLSRGQSIAQALSTAESSELSNKLLKRETWVLKPARTMALLEKLATRGTPLEECTERIFQGLKTSGDKVYVLELEREKRGAFVARSPHLDRSVELERELCKMLIKGTEMRPFVPLPPERIVIFPYIRDDSSMRLIHESELKRQFPLTYAYLRECEDSLRGREDGRMDKEGWYGYIYPKALDVMSLPKLITPDLAPRSSFLLDKTGELFLLGGAAGGYGLLPVAGLDRSYLLGLLNSSLINFYITSTGQRMESGYFSFEKRFICSTPIRLITSQSPQHERKLHDNIASLTEQIVKLHEKLLSIRAGHDQERIQRQTVALTQQLNNQVYELYELSSKEVTLVECADSISE